LIGGVNLDIDFEKLDAERIAQLSSLSLAHIGDGVYELLARVHCASKHGSRVGELHKSAVSLVSAEAQARAAARILPILTDEEVSIYKRGRNSKPSNIPKHSSPGEYGAATGIEALFGYLYLKGMEERIGFLWQKCLECLEDK